MIEPLYNDHIAELKRRHDEALSRESFDGVVIFSGSLHVQFLDDQYYPFKVNPHFKAWTPVTDNADSFIVYIPGQRPVLYFNQPVDYWYKPAQTPDGFWTTYFDIKLMRSLQSTWAEIEKLAGRFAFIGEMGNSHDWDSQHDCLTLNPEPVLEYLHFERTVKTPYEIECIRNATAAAVTGHSAAEKSFRDGASEYEIHLDYCRAVSQSEEELPYSNIVALNENAAVLHYQSRNRASENLQPRHSFLIDAGASFNGYAADITRTYSYESAEFAEMISAMHSVQQEICKEVCAGEAFLSTHQNSHYKIASLLKAFEFINVNAEQAVETGLSKTFYPHGLGHYLGLQVHDVGGYLLDDSGTTQKLPEGHPNLRINNKLKANQVLTVEPGFYFIDCLLRELRNSDNAKFVNWPRVEEFAKYGGIRIEDNVVVTDKGPPRNLTRQAFDQAASKSGLEL